MAKQGRWGAGFGGIVVEKQKLFAFLRPIGELTEDKETPVRQANHGLRAAGHGPFLHGFRFMARFNASKSGRITADAVDQLKAYPIAPRSGIADQGFCVPRSEERREGKECGGTGQARG